MAKRRILVTAILFAALFVLAVPRPAEGSWSVSISYFHEQLSPYGRWVVAGSYGNCWVPARVSASWSPYFDGEWIWTDYGWTWVSYDPWGDLPYHFGSWVWVDPYGWVWVPGTIWAPAWVTWAYTDDYIGWAPVPPSFILTASGYSGRPIVVSQRFYCFVPTSQFVGVNVSTVRAPVQQNATIFTQATKTTGYTVSGGIVRTAGPSTSRIEKITGRRIERVSIDRAKTRPMTLQASGVAKGASLRVAAPASERARAIHAASAAAPKHEKVAAAAPKHEKVAAATPKHEKVASAPPAVKSAEKPKQERAPAPSQRQAETRIAAGAGHGAPPAQPPPGQVKKEQAAPAKALPTPQRGQGQEKKKEKEKG